jgi:flagellar biosynthesis protein FlhA
VSSPALPTTGRFLQSELLLAGAMLCILVVMLVPLPTALLDMLLAFNLGLTLLLLLITMSARQPLDLSVFPSLLLLLTLYRLSLNVATTRLVLLDGETSSSASLCSSS